jgi:hypothetical protein
MKPTSPYVSVAAALGFLITGIGVAMAQDTQMLPAPHHLVAAVIANSTTADKAALDQQRFPTADIVGCESWQAAKVQIDKHFEDMQTRGAMFATAWLADPIIRDNLRDWHLLPRDDRQLTVKLMIELAGKIINRNVALSPKNIDGSQALSGSWDELSRTIQMGLDKSAAFTFIAIAHELGHEHQDELKKTVLGIGKKLHKDITKAFMQLDIIKPLFEDSSKWQNSSIEEKQDLISKAIVELSKQFPSSYVGSKVPVLGGDEVGYDIHTIRDIVVEGYAAGTMKKMFPVEATFMERMAHGNVGVVKVDATGRQINWGLSPVEISAVQSEIGAKQVYDKWIKTAETNPIAGFFKGLIDDTVFWGYYELSTSLHPENDKLAVKHVTDKMKKELGIEVDPTQIPNLSQASLDKLYQIAMQPYRTGLLKDATELWSKSSSQQDPVEKWRTLLQQHPEYEGHLRLDMASKTIKTARSGLGFMPNHHEVEAEKFVDIILPKGTTPTTRDMMERANQHLGLSLTAQDVGVDVMGAAKKIIQAHQAKVVKKLTEPF